LEDAEEKVRRSKLDKILGSGSGDTGISAALLLSSSSFKKKNGRERYHGYKHDYYWKKQTCAVLSKILESV
jgi:hypothetical protein